MESWFSVRTKSLSRHMESEGVTVLTYTIDYPQFASLLYPESARKLNAYYRNQAHHLARTLANELYPQAAADRRDREKEGFPFNAYEVLHTFTLTYAGDCIASLYADTYQFTGGAHGNTVRTSDTWDVARARRITLGEIFPDNPDYRRDLIDAIGRDIAQDSESYFEDAAALAEQSFDENSFYLTPDALVIYYQQYDIAPYSTGIPEFRIPYGQYGARLPHCAPVRRGTRVSKVLR